MAFWHAIYPPGLVSNNKLCALKFPDGVAEVSPVITIRTTKAGPTTMLPRGGGGMSVKGMSVGLTLSKYAPKSVSGLPS